MTGVNRWAPPPERREVKQPELPIELGAVVAPPESPQHWQTPERLLDVVRLLVDREEIGLDVCSSMDNPTAALKFYVEGGLERPWDAPAETVIFCNPPFSDCEDWARKAAMWWAARRSRKDRKAVVLVLLLPLRPHRVWWRDWVAPACPVVAVVGEAVRFKGAENDAPWPVALCVYGASEFSVFDAFASVGVEVDFLRSVTAADVLGGVSDE
jgi:hypothetical protein